MKTYWNFNGNLNAISEWQPNCWIQVTCPTEQDQQELQERFQIPDYFLSDIADTDERARYEYDDGWMLIILRIPYVKEVRSRTPYTTVPLGIIHKRDVTITVCNFETNMMIDFVSYQQKRGEGFTDYVDMIFRLFLSSAVWYLKRLKQINALIEKSKKNLDKEVNNESLIGLSRLQDSLTYFVTSIRGNENLLAKLKFKLQVDELDADLIEDVNIEMSQARETTSIYSDIVICKENKKNILDIPEKYLKGVEFHYVEDVADGCPSPYLVLGDVGCRACGIFCLHRLEVGMIG